jgi:predicted secreted protein
MKKNKEERGDLRNLSRLIADLSDLEKNRNDILKAERKKIKAIQNVVDRLCIKLKDRAEKNKEISSLLQSLKETTSTLRTLLSQ